MALELSIGVALLPTLTRGGVLATAVGGASLAQVGRVVSHPLPGRRLVPAVGPAALTGLGALTLAGVGPDTLMVRLHRWDSPAPI